jgi:outer membrane lipoprotein-sorting protein
MSKTLSIIILFICGITSALASDDELLKKIQDYLNGIKSMQATMSQINPDKGTQTGKIFLKRDPNLSYGKLRLEYQPPATDLIVVDGEQLQHIDLKTREISSYSVDNTPASFLLKKNLRFGENVRVQSVDKYGDVVQVTLINFGDSGGMSLRIDLTTKPFLKLIGWQVYDGQGNLTTVSLKNVQININVNDGLFRLN